MIWTGYFDFDISLIFDGVLAPYLEENENAIDDFEQREMAELIEKIGRLQKNKIIPIDCTKDHKLDQMLLDFQTFMFRRIMRYSFVTLLYSNVEAFAMRMCRDHAAKHSVEVSEHELQYKSVRYRVNNYLGKLEQLTNKSMPKEIDDQFDGICKIRNRIVHDGGSIKYQKDKKREKLSKYAYPGYSILKGNLIILECTFCEFALKKTREYLTELNKLLTD